MIYFVGFLVLMGIGFIANRSNNSPASGESETDSECHNHAHGSSLSPAYQDDFMHSSNADDDFHYND